MSVNPTDPLHLINVKRLQVFPEALPSLSPAGDELLINKSFCKQLEGKEVQYRDV